MNLRSFLSSAVRTAAQAAVKTITQRSAKQESKQRTKQAARHAALYPDPSSRPIEWNIQAYGLPSFSYQPSRDQAPDPGEVVWTWVPFEEHDGRGKDRPVLVLSIEGEYVFFAQMTSKDHADQGIRKDKYGTWWLDIGTGDWDSKGRPSEIKLNIIWVVHQSQIRREGAALDQRTFHKVVTAIAKIHSTAHENRA